METVISNPPGPSILSNVVGFIVVVALFFLFYKYCRWAIDDAEVRGKSAFLIFIAVVFFFPFGLIAWLLFRPEINSGLGRKLRSDGIDWGKGLW